MKSLKKPFEPESEETNDITSILWSHCGLNIVFNFHGRTRRSYMMPLFFSQQWWGCHKAFRTAFFSPLKTISIPLDLNGSSSRNTEHMCKEIQLYATLLRNASVVFFFVIHRNHKLICLARTLDHGCACHPVQRQACHPQDCVLLQDVCYSPTDSVSPPPQKILGMHAGLRALQDQCTYLEFWVCTLVWECYGHWRSFKLHPPRAHHPLRPTPVAPP